MSALIDALAGRGITWSAPGPFAAPIGLAVSPIDERIVVTGVHRQGAFQRATIERYWP